MEQLTPHGLLALAMVVRILEPIQNMLVNPPFARHQTRRTYTPPTIFALQNSYLVR
jgi:hypothetical protein